MSIALQRQQLIALIVLVLLTILVLGITLLYTVAHIDVWHTLLSFGKGFLPNVMYFF